MDIGEVRSFLALAGQSHFGRTARLLNLSQPALTKQIRRLEEVAHAAARALVNLRCGAADRIRAPARPASHVHRRATPDAPEFSSTVGGTTPDITQRTSCRGSRGSAFQTCDACAAPDAWERIYRRRWSGSVLSFLRCIPTIQL